MISLVKYVRIIPPGNTMEYLPATVVPDFLKDLLDEVGNIFAKRSLKEVV